MAESTPYRLSMTGEEADSGIQTGMQAGATAGVLLGDGRGGVSAGAPGMDFGFPTLKGSGPPTASTAANLGQFYFDMMATDIPYLYVCVGYSSSGFTWATVGSEVISGDGGGSDDGGSPVPPHGEAGQALIKLSDSSGDYGWGSVSNISAGAVGTTELADEAVTGAKIGQKALLEKNYGDLSIPTEAHKNASITRAKLADDVKVLSFAAVTVTAGTFGADSTYPDFPYRAAVSLDGVTADHYVEVIFDPADAVSGDFSPVCASYEGGVYIYAASARAASILAIISTPVN